MQPTQDASQSRLLAVLLSLGRRAREAEDEAELGFILANETRNLVEYRQAAIWLADEGVSALSGIAVVEHNAPYVQWLQKISRRWFAFPEQDPWRVTAQALSNDEQNDWANWLPPKAVCVPIPAVGRTFKGGLLILARDAEWSDAQLGLLKEWVAIWAGVRALVESGQWPNRYLQRWRGKARSIRPPHRRAKPWYQSKPLWLSVFVGVLSLTPVRLTVLAPGELIPMNPSIVRAPMDGVIAQVHIYPNDVIDVGTPLFEFDRTNIRNRLLVAERSLETVRAELRQRTQLALVDASQGAQVAMLQGDLAQREIELEYLRELDQRTRVLATRAGVVLFDDPSEWVGRPVVTGERVMVVAQEREAELEVWLAPADAVALEPGSRVVFFLNADPTRPLQATLRTVGHEAVLRPDGQYAYRVRAVLDEHSERTRIGLKGTARLESNRVPAIYWVLRRPLAALRGWLGL